MKDKKLRPLIALLTDYGTEGWYVASLKAVIKGICPAAEIIDISHQVTPQSVLEGSLMLYACHRTFPRDTIFLAIIDPGVGTSREAVVVRAADQWFIAPNNGLLGLVVQEAGRHECRVLSNPEYHLAEPSATFHGRDIFAPAAAHLAAGVPWTDLAPSKTTCFGLPASTASYDRGYIVGNVVYFDHFGNAITNIPRRLFELSFPPEVSTVADQPARKGARKAARQMALVTPAIAISIGDYVIRGISATYGDAKLGEVLAYWGSVGFLELAVNHGNAKNQMNLNLLDKVTIRRIGQPARYRR